MSNGPVAKYSFLPWSRQGIASLLTNPDPLDDSAAATVSLPVQLRVNDARTVDLTLRLYGPGDVIGLDPRQVVRTEPRHETKDFIPNYLPAIEFARPDLPWLFTPAAPDTSAGSTSPGNHRSRRRGARCGSPRA